MSKNSKTDFYLGDKNLPTASAEHEYDAEKIKEMVLSAKDIIHFASKYFFITSLADGKQLIGLYPAQKRIIQNLVKHRFNILMSCRQAGKTTLMTVYSLWYTCFQADKRVLIVANKEDTAKMILRRIKMAYEKLPNWMKPGVKQWDMTEVIFANDSSISISTTTSSAARGESINVLIIDECAHIQDHILNEFWKSVIPVISSHKTTKLFVVSTPNGTGNKFYEIYSQAERGDLKEWYHDRIDWWEVPGRDLKWKASMEEILAKEDKSFDQEFGNVFSDSGQSALDGGLIEQYRKNSRKPLYIMEDGKYKIWEMPNPNHLYVIGVDVAEGVGQAASVAQILDITDLTNIKQVACYHNNAIDPFHFAEILNRMTNQWGRPFLFIERNNCGGQIIDALKHVHFYHNIADYTPEKNTNPDRLGIYSSIPCKYAGVMNMRYWMNSLRSVIINDIALVQELETFVKYPNGTWKAKAGEYIHDDRVMALVWALFSLETAVTQKYYEITEYDSRGKPRRIEPVSIEDLKYFKLDPMYEDPNAPIPTHVGVNPYMDSEGIESLQRDGWTVGNTEWGNY